MLDNLTLIFLCTLPIAFLLIYIYKKDVVEKEPIYLLSILFILGVFAGLSALYISFLLKELFPFLSLSYSNMNVIQTLIKSLILIALIEESLKWILNYMAIWKNKNLDHLYDPIVYATFLSLGFATIENIIYAFAYSSYGFMPIFLRGITSVPCHAVFGIFMGYYIGISKSALMFNKKKQSYKYKLLSLIIPVLLHFLYTVLLIKVNLITSILFVFYILTLYLISYKKIKQLSHSHQIINESKYNI